MGGRKRQAYLLKRGDAHLQFVGDIPRNRSEPTLLFTPALENFKGFPDENYDFNQLSTVSQALEEVANLQGDERGKIEMFGQYDTFYDIPRIYTTVTFPEQLVTKLSNVLAEPKISIRGKYQIVQPDISSHCYQHQQCLLHQLLQPSPPQSFPVCSYYPNSTPRVVWTPVYDDDGVEFSVEGLLLSTDATWAKFNGIERMASSYASHKLIHAQLTYSVILEWVDFALDLPGVERNTLAKLYENKPFADCILVSSNKQEFECHRSIVSTHSDVLFAALGNGMKESQTHRIEMEDVGGDAVKLLLKFMYSRKDFMKDLRGKSEQVVLELLLASHKYNIGTLELFLCQFLCRNPSNWFSIDGALVFYTFTVNVDNLENLTEKLWSLMRGNSQQLLSSTTYKNWMTAKPLEAAQFTAKLLESVMQKLRNHSESGVNGERNVEEIASDEEEEWDSEDEEEEGIMDDHSPQ